MELDSGMYLDSQGGNDGLGMHQAGVAQVVQACMPYKVICQGKPNRQHAKMSNYKCCV